MSFCQITPVLEDNGEYTASESTFYQVLHEEKMQYHRGQSQELGKQGNPTLYCATAPNQVWIQDITYLVGTVKCLFYHFYLIIDIFSRNIVGCEVWEERSTDHANELIKRACIAQRHLTDMPLVLHFGNGSSMKGATMQEKNCMHWA